MPTSSPVRLRQPIYASSVRRWKRFEDRMLPARIILDDAGIEY